VLKRLWVLHWLAVVVSFSGVAVSGLLVKKHVSGGSGPDWLNAICEGGQESQVSCSRVLQSRWAWIPPKPEKEEAGAEEVGKP